MSDSKKLGMCNYCQELGPVFEQEDKDGTPTFLICHNCISDINVGIAIKEQVEKKRETWDRKRPEDTGYKTFKPKAIWELYHYESYEDYQKDRERQRRVAEGERQRIEGRRQDELF